MRLKQLVETIPEKKINAVKELAELIKTRNSILIASIKDLPASQFQEISKKLRGKAVVKVPKKNLIFRAIDESKNKKLIEFKNQIKEDVAILFSDLDCFDLAGELLKSKSSAKAKPGQEAPFDISVEAGPTDLVPGPAISELGALGIQIKIDKGKINIKESKVIAKEGSKISQGAADIMAKLDIKPFSIGFIPLSGFEIKEGKLYLDIKINKEEALEELKSASGHGLSFAVEIGYFCKETVTVMMQKAAGQEKRLIRVINGEPEPEVVEEKKEEPKEEKKEEVKAPAAAGLGALFG